MIDADGIETIPSDERQSFGKDVTTVPSVSSAKYNDVIVMTPRHLAVLSLGGLSGDHMYLRNLSRTRDYHYVVTGEFCLLNVR